MVSVTTGLAVAGCVSPGPARKATPGNSVTRHPRTVARVGCPSTATSTLSAASMTQQGQSLWHIQGHTAIVQPPLWLCVCVCVLVAQDCLSNLANLLVINLACLGDCSTCVPFVFILLRCICMDGYEGDGFSCQPIDLCSQPERGGCSQNVSGIRL